VNTQDPKINVVRSTTSLLGEKKSVEKDANLSLKPEDVAGVGSRKSRDGGPLSRKGDHWRRLGKNAQRGTSS